LISKDFAESELWVTATKAAFLLKGFSKNSYAHNPASATNKNVDSTLGFTTAKAYFGKPFLFAQLGYSPRVAHRSPRDFWLRFLTIGF
jgi:hypothetical protein